MTKPIALGIVVLSYLVSVPHAALASSDTDSATSGTSAAAIAEQALLRVERGEDQVLSDKSKIAVYREALDLALRAVDLDDNNANAHFAVFASQGRILLLEGATVNPVNLLKANKELDRTLQLDPDHADALASRGGLYRQLPWLLGGNLTKAESFLSRAIQLNPDAVGARIELAQTYRDMGSPERGVELLETAALLAEEQGRYERRTQASTLLQEFRAKQ